MLYYYGSQHVRCDDLIECTRFLYCRLNLGIEDVCHTEHKKENPAGSWSGIFLKFFFLEVLHITAWSPLLAREKGVMRKPGPTREGGCIKKRGGGGEVGMS